MAEFTSRLRKAWNVFTNRAPESFVTNLGNANYYNPARSRITRGNERSMLNSVYNRVSMDVATIDFKHIITDEDGRYIKTVTSALNDRLTLNANKDQTSRDFIQDVVITMFEEGCVAIVPVDVDDEPSETETQKILSWRTGVIKEWYPDRVRVDLYNDRTGLHQEVLLYKTEVAIIQNPYYSIMNEPNSTLSRLNHKLNLLDVIDEQSSSGKLDLIVQLPYALKGEAREKQAEVRRNKIVEQLAGSKYGIAYIDSTEHITQLNRPIENNLLKQVEYLTNLFHTQLGITQAILDGTADEKTMLNYYSRVVEPIAAAIKDALNWKFFSKTARSQHNKIEYFRDPFKLVPVNDIAEIADKFTRNEILTSNEIRQVVGFKPAKDPKADTLNNSNINKPEEPMDGQAKIQNEGEWDTNEEQYV